MHKTVTDVGLGWSFVVGNSVICNGVTDVDLASDPLWPSSWPQPPPPHQRRLRIRDLRKPGPRACCISCSPPTTRRQLHQRSERPCTPSAFTSHNASTMPGGCPQQPGTSDNSQGHTTCANFAATKSSRSPHGRVPELAARTIAATRSSRPSSPASAAHGWAEPKAGTRIDRDYEQFRVRAQTLLDRPALTTPAPQAG